MAVVQEIKAQAKLTSWEFFYAVDLAMACLISYSVMTHVLAPLLGLPHAFLGGMWAAVSTVIVFRPTRSEAISAGISRLSATCVSFALCLGYLLVLPFHAVGLAVLLGVGTLIMVMLDRRDDIITTAVTTVVVMFVAANDPAAEAWHQPILRLGDTFIGIVIGVACKWIGSFLYYRWIGEPAK